MVSDIWGKPSSSTSRDYSPRFPADLPLTAAPPPSVRGHHDTTTASPPGPLSSPLPDAPSPFPVTLSNTTATAASSGGGHHSARFAANDGTSGRSDLLSDVDSGKEKKMQDQALFLASAANNTTHTMKLQVDDELEPRPRYWHAAAAGAVGGACGDMLIHSLDTVKTRQQGDPHMPPRYNTFAQSYSKILRQEGIGRGLYSGWFPALLGSVPGTGVFFVAYEFSKRSLIDFGVRPSWAYLAGGLIADLVASGIYVPSEVLKTRLQLQGRPNNPHFTSGYNYRGTLDAARTMVRQEGFGSLFHGYKATLMRDLPFAGLQFFFYEQSRSWVQHRKQRRDIGWASELLTGAGAGGAAGVLTCPLDVVKTRLMTQINRPLAKTEAVAYSVAAARSTNPPTPTAEPPSPTAPPVQTPSSPMPLSPALAARVIVSSPPNNTRAAPGAGKALGPAAAGLGSQPAGVIIPIPSESAISQKQHQHARLISTSSPATHSPRPGAARLETSSIRVGLQIIYRTEGLGGWFRGVGPRTVWTSVQSGSMLFLYQYFLRVLGKHGPGERSEIPA